MDVVNFIKEEESGKVEGERKIEERGKKNHLNEQKFSSFSSSSEYSVQVRARASASSFSLLRCYHGVFLRVNEW